MPESETPLRAALDRAKLAPAKPQCVLAKSRSLVGGHHGRIRQRNVDAREHETGRGGVDRARHEDLHQAALVLEPVFRGDAHTCRVLSQTPQKRPTQC